MKRIGFALTILLCLFSNVAIQADTAIQLERPNKERFAKEFAAYSMLQKTNRQKKWLGYGFIAASVIGAGTGVGVYWHNKSKDSLGTASAEKTTSDSSDKKSSIKETFKEALIFSFASSLIALFWNIVSRTDSYFKDRLGQGGKLGAVFALAKRLETSLGRLEWSVATLQEQRDDIDVVQYQRAELIDAFSLFVRSLEKFGAILLYEMKQLHKKDDMIIGYWGQVTDRIFLYCDNVAKKLEHDLNHEEWLGFSRVTIKSVKNLQDMTLGFVGDNVSLPQVG